MNVNPSSLISLLALSCYTTLLIVVLKRDSRGRLYRSFGLYLLTMMVWSFGSFMVFADFGFLDTIFWTRFKVVGSTAVPVAFFAFVQTLLRKNRKYWLFVGLVAYVLTQVANVSGLIIEEASLEGGLLRSEYGAALALPSVLWVFFIGFSAFDLVVEYRGIQDSLHRNRLLYLLIVIIGIFAVSLTKATDLRAYPLDIAFNSLAAFLIAHAILRHQLLDMTVVLRKGLLYSIPTTIIGVGYFLIIFLALNILHAYSGTHLFVLSLAVAILTALVAQPLKDRMQFWIDKRFFREKYDASQMLQRLSHTTATVLELEELTSLILAELTTTMQIEKAAFFLVNKQNGEYELAAQRGLDPNPSIRLRQDHAIVRWLAEDRDSASKYELEIEPHFESLQGQEEGDLEQISAELFLALKAKEQLVGILAVGPKRSEEAYSVEDQVTLNTLAHQAAVAIENARLFDAERLQRREAEILREASTALTSALDVSQVLDDILVYLAQVVSYDSACVFLLVQEGKSLVATAGRGFPDLKMVVGKNYSTQNELTQKIIGSGKPIILEDASRDPTFQAWGGTSFVRGWMGVPLIVRGEIIGLLTLDNRKPKIYGEADAALAQAFANQAAIALENARLFEAATQQAEEADTLRQAAAALTGTLQQEEAIQRILEQLARVVPYDSASVQLLREGYVEIVGGRGWSDSATIVGSRFPVPGDNPNSVVIEQRQPFILGDAPNAFGTFREGTHSHIRSWLGVPLMVQDSIIGMLALDSIQTDYFTAHHARLVAAFADQVAIVLENARLFSQLSQRVDELATLFSTSTAVSAHIEVQQVLSEITRQTTLALNGTSCYVSILEAAGDSLTVVAEFFGPEANPLEQVSDLGSTYPLSLEERQLFESMQVRVTHINDPDGDPMTLRELMRYNGKTALSIPLVVRGQVIGELALWDSRSERTFSEAEVKLGLTIANQAAIALEQARLYELERQRAEQLSALRATAADITAELELSKLLQIILKRAVHLLVATGGDLGLYDARNAELEIVTSLKMGKDYTGTRMAMGEGVMGRVAKTLEPLIIDDYSFWEGRSPQYMQGTWHVAMASPLMVHGSLVGAIGVVDENPERNFTPEDLELLNLFAQQAAIAIENARLYSETRERAAELDALHTATSTLLTTLDLQALLNQILDAALHSIPNAERGTLLLLDQESKQLVIRAVAGYSEDSPASGSVSQNRVYAARAIRQRKPLLIPDAASEPEGRYALDTADIHAVKSAIVAPMILDEESLGALSLNSTRISAFSEADLRLLVSFAATATAAIRNAQLHAEVQRLAVTDQLTGLYNRRGLFEMGEREIERVRRFGHPLSAIMLDIDLFKEINDTYSHAVGDEVLRILANRCQQNLREVDILGRYGGEEFAILLPETDEQAATQVAERLRRSLADTPIDTYRGPILVTISLGLTSVTGNPPDLAVLLDRADTAMYAAKQAGRNRVVIADPLHYNINIASPKE